MPVPVKIEGKTYSLFGSGSNTDYFYSTVDKGVNSLLKNYNSSKELLLEVRRASKSLSRFRAFTEKNINVFDIRNELGSFTKGAEEHRKKQPFFRIWNNVMRLHEWQYLMYFLEFELVNRINSSGFRNCEVKIALLPHCLRDLTKKCRAVSDGTDHKCAGCSKNCFINDVSSILKEKDIIPYIWMTSKIGNIIRSNNPGNKTAGVLGIACIPELINGMRHCEKKGLPVVGIPLDANRCVRWMGDFHPNSVNAGILARLTGF